MAKAELPAETIELQALAAAPASEESEIHRVLRAQLALALRLLPALRAAASELAQK
jgi:hypothetical protein